MSGAAFIPGFEFVGITGGLALALINFVLNFDPMNPLSTSFVLLNMLALGVMFVGMKIKWD